MLHRFTNQGRNLKLIRDGMVEAVNGRRGTGRRAQVETQGIQVGGKTGTAQVIRIKQYQHLKEQNIPYKYRDHAWFTCFAPASNPEIAVTVLVEHGLHGGSASAPIAAKIMTRYFNEKLEQLQVPDVLEDGDEEDEHGHDDENGVAPAAPSMGTPLQF